MLCKALLPALHPGLYLHVQLACTSAPTPTPPGGSVCGKQWWKCMSTHTHTNKHCTFSNLESWLKLRAEVKPTGVSWGHVSTTMSPPFLLSTRLIFCEALLCVSHRKLLTSDLSASPSTHASGQLPLGQVDEVTLPLKSGCSARTIYTSCQISPFWLQ